jgi:hypothetical protein
MHNAMREGEWTSARTRKLLTLAALVAFVDLACAPGSAPAQTTPQTAPQTAPQKKPAPVAAAPTTPSAASPTPNVAEVAGFRSARFGMTEAEVRAAIQKDFKVKSDAIQSEENKAEQTHALVVAVPDVLPGGGSASISYVLGFKTKTLIQVGITWSKATDDKMTPEQLFSNANVLRAHFIGSGYKPETVSTNMPINGGILMFRGSDAEAAPRCLFCKAPSAREKITSGC